MSNLKLKCMRKLIGLFVLLTLWGVQICFAQTREVTGTVVDKSDKSPLPGVSVIIKNNRAVGTATNINGKYSIKVNENDVLIFTFVGMKDQEIAVAGKNVIDVELVPATESLEEVVVVGYGTVRREAKTGSITSVGGEKLAEVPVISVDKMLAGKMAGVMITTNSGQPGASSQIRIRGTSSINAGNEPLYVVDGIPIESGDQSVMNNTSNAIAAFNPNDIESITVLKDAAAASIYGSRASNGVILITTKAGKEGKSQFTARAKYGVSWLANDNNFRVMSGAELLDYQRTAAINAGVDPDDPTGTYYRPYELLNRPQTNWMDHFSRLGNMQEYEVTAQGGSAKTKFYSSLSYQKNEGVFYGIEYDKLTARVNVDQKLHEKLDFGARINVAYIKSSDVAMQSLYYVNPAWAGLQILPWTPAYDANGDHNVNISENSNSNPRATAKYDDNWEKQYRFIGNMYLEWKPIKGLSVKTTNAAELTFGEGRSYQSLHTNASARLWTSHVKYQTLTTSNTITYNNTFGDHSLRVLAGQEAMKRDYNMEQWKSYDVDPNIPYPPTSTDAKDGLYNYGMNTRSLMSFFGILDYSYASRYYLQASLRYDGSSLFAEGNQWGMFWSVGGSWNMHNEKFMENAAYLDVLKLRLSYGVNGNNNISPYKQYGVYGSTTINGITGMLPSSPANNELSWEKNKSWNLGVDFGFFNRFSGSIDLYKRNTTDMLLNRPVSGTTGFTSNLKNVGELENKGIEFQIEGTVLKSGDFNWDLGFNIAFNKSKVISLDGDQMINHSSVLKYIKGERLFTFYLKDYYGVNPVNGEALWRDEQGLLTNNYDDARYVYAGSPEPKYTGGFNTTFSWKGLALSAFFEMKGGNKVMLINENYYLQSDGSQMGTNQFASATNYWKKPGDTGCNPKPIAGNSTKSNEAYSTRWIEKGDYLRIKDVTLSYTLPAHIIKPVGISNVKFYVSALNLYTFHDVNFFDPERGVDGVGAGIHPMTKTFVGGIEIAF